MKVKQKDQVWHVSRIRLFNADNHEKLLNRKMDRTWFFLLMSQKRTSLLLFILWKCFHFSKLREFTWDYRLLFHAGTIMLCVETFACIMYPHIHLNHNTVFRPTCIQHFNTELTFSSIINSRSSFRGCLVTKQSPTKTSTNRWTKISTLCITSSRNALILPIWYHCNAKPES